MKKYALLSVTNKIGIVDFAKGLTSLGYSLLSTGGTSTVLKENHIMTEDVSDYTDYPEVFSGRVKTLHPKIHGAILHDRNKQADEAKRLGVERIDLVVVNLYNFKDEAQKKHLGLVDAIEYIDIGGPTMLRAAAKNWQHVLSVIDPLDYGNILHALRSGPVPNEFRQYLARKVFATISAYDAMIASYFAPPEPSQQLPLGADLVTGLRYGENPKQKAALYKLVSAPRDGFCDIEILQGKELSYNNYLDLDAAAAIIREFHGIKAVTIVKHNNPCGTAIEQRHPNELVKSHQQKYSESLKSIYERALSGDPRSAFGGIVATNAEIDDEAASAMAELFLECIIAPSYSEGAKVIFSKKKNLRIIAAPWITHHALPQISLRTIQGALLVQDQDSVGMSAWSNKTANTPTEAQMTDLEFAWKVCAHVKSNAIVYVKNGTTLTVGAGQMSRIDAATFAAEKARAENKDLDGAVMASDAFFPFRDSVDLAASYGIKGIVQPGGSLRDQESIDACNEHGIAMVFTGERHFKH